MILPLEDQVCDLVYAKKLKELGVPQESLWSYYWHGFNPLNWGLDLSDKVPEKKFINKKISAYTVAELGEMLPPCETQTYKVRSNLFDRNWKWECHYDIDLLDRDKKLFKDYFTEKTEANARAKMLIHLLENKIITSEEIRERMAA